MAIIKKNDFKQMDEESLKKKLSDLKKEMVKINAQISTGTPPENPGRVREMKKTVARILTKLKQKGIELREEIR